MSPSSGIRASFPKCVDRALTVRQFAPRLCGCGFESRRCLHKESVVVGKKSEEDNEEEEIGQEKEGEGEVLNQVEERIFRVIIKF